MIAQVVLYASCADEGPEKSPEASKFVPCKLNNAKTNYNTLDNYNCLSFE